jgi:tRNA modification GTPase
MTAAMRTINVATVLTPPGVAAIAVVRIRGNLTPRFLAAHFSTTPTPSRCVHGELRDRAGQVIDDPVVVLHDDGGVSADINLHGGPWVVAATLDLLRQNGFEVVEPADLDLLDGETVLDRELHAALPLARTEAGIRMLLAQPAAWREFIASRPSVEQIEALLEDRCLMRLLNPPRVAIVGPPNVGKSTLANQLFGQTRSITADMPGTTRDWVGEIANIDGVPVVLVDTPGLRETSDEIEAAAIARARRIIGSADLVVSVREPETDAPVQPGQIYVMNKADLLTDPMDIDPQDCLTIATTGKGLRYLRERIRRFFGCDDLTPDRPRCWTDRQRDALQRDPRDVLVGHE